MLIESWRWFGSNDPISLKDIKMVGAKSIVSALNNFKIGDVWTYEDITEHKISIEKEGFKWLVIESIPIHESIKYGGDLKDYYIDNFIESMKNMSKAGINILCYNFMPVLDWTRTDLKFKYHDGSYALRFDIIELIVFDLFILKRLGKHDYDSNQIKKADALYKQMTQNELQVLKETILKGLPGSMVESYDLEIFKTQLKKYKSIDNNALKQNLKYFLSKIGPTADKYNIKLAIHPDDPPFEVFGIPRIVSNLKDFQDIYSYYPSNNNGVTLCVGSLASINNDIYNIIEHIRNRIHFVHLRNVIKDSDKHSFTESDHLNGDINMAKVINELLKVDTAIPFRPDHGHLMLDDINKKNINPGYSLIGRLRGLSELRGIIYSHVN